MARRRTIIAFLIAPLAIPLAFLCLALPTEGLGWEILGLTVIYAISALPFAYLSELLLGVPAWLFIRRYAIRAGYAFAGGGALLAFVCFVVVVEALRGGNFHRNPHPIEFDPIDPGLLWIDVLAGAACGILFRNIVFPRQSGKNAG
jgi:hypothetical protein